MMDDLIKSMESFIQKSVSLSRDPNKKVDISKFKECVALDKNEWKCTGGRLPEDNSNDFITEWRKEGEVDREVRLSFGEQQLWLAYMEKKYKERQ